MVSAALANVVAKPRSQAAQVMALIALLDDHIDEIATARATLVKASKELHGYAVPEAETLAVKARTTISDLSKVFSQLKAIARKRAKRDLTWRDDFFELLTSLDLPAGDGSIDRGRAMLRAANRRRK